jgi:hypothetical protein
VCDTPKFQIQNLLLFLFFCYQHIIDPSDLTQKIIVLFIILLIRKEEAHMKWTVKRENPLIQREEPSDSRRETKW